VRAQGAEIPIGAPPSREDATLDAESCSRRAAEHAEAAHGVVPRQDDNLDALSGLGVEREELPDEMEGDPGAGWGVEPVELERHVRPVVRSGLEDAVLLLEVEQRA
jgi:hypothetical protein